MKTYAPLALLLIGLLLAGAACSSPDADSGEAAAAPADNVATVPSPLTATNLGDAPDFVLPTLAGDSLRLSDLRGQTVLLNFWATWCAPCLEEIPELIALHDELSPHGFTVVGISIDPEGADLVGPFSEDLGITYPLPLDTDGSVAEAYGGVWALPTTYVIDAEGQITQRVIGLFPVAEMTPTFREMVGLPAE